MPAKITRDYGSAVLLGSSALLLVLLVWGRLSSFDPFRQWLGLSGWGSNAIACAHMLAVVGGWSVAAARARWSWGLVASMILAPMLLIGTPMLSGLDAEALWFRMVLHTPWLLVLGILGSLALAGGEEPNISLTQWGLVIVGVSGLLFGFALYLIPFEAPLAAPALGVKVALLIVVPMLCACTATVAEFTREGRRSRSWVPSGVATLVLVTLATWQ